MSDKPKRNHVAVTEEVSTEHLHEIIQRIGKASDPFGPEVAILGCLSTAIILQDPTITSKKLLAIAKDASAYIALLLMDAPEGIN